MISRLVLTQKHPTLFLVLSSIGVQGASELVVGGRDSGGATLSLYGQGSGKQAEEARAQGKLPPPEVKWAKTRVHGDKGILTLHGAASSAGSGDGSVVVASCSEGDPRSA
jgi:hypothetical protein